MKRSDGAKTWSTVLFELAQVKVSVEWERPTWRVSWQDGPTREALMSRAAALGRYRVGAPLPYEDLRFARSNCAVAVALAWFARGEPGVAGRGPPSIAEVEAFCADTGYPQTRFDAAASGGPPSCCAGWATATSRRWVRCWPGPPPCVAPG